MEHRGVIKSQEMLSRFWLSAYLEGASINFLTENRKVMVNATEMAKPFGKQVSDWLRLPSFVQFIDNLEAVRKSHRSELVNQVNGVGTLFHRDVAIEFARWLAPAFGIWCNDRILELMQHGVIAINPEDYILNPDMMIKAMQELKEERAEKERLRIQSEIQAK